MSSKDTRYIVTLFVTQHGKERLQEFTQREGAEHIPGLIAKALAHCSRLTENNHAAARRLNNSLVPRWPHTEAVSVSFGENAYLALDTMRIGLGFRSNAEVITFAMAALINREGSITTEGALPTFV